MARTDALLARFRGCDHGLVLGSIHATRAHIAHAAGGVRAFEQSLGDTERWFVPIGALGLIAQCERLRELRDSIGRLPVFSPQVGDENARTEIVNRQPEQSAAVTVLDEGGIRPRRQSGSPGR